MKDGGPAFPSQNGPDHFNVSGMSMRDYFAAHALNGLVRMYVQGDAKRWSAEIAGYAYDIADAMLKAREQS